MMLDLLNQQSSRADRFLSSKSLSISNLCLYRINLAGNSNIRATTLFAFRCINIHIYWFEGFFVYSIRLVFHVFTNDWFELMFIEPQFNEVSITFGLISRFTGMQSSRVVWFWFSEFSRFLIGLKGKTHLLHENQLPVQVY